MTPQEALDRIAALCDEVDRSGSYMGIFNTGAVRAVLAEVSPEPGLAAGGTNNEDPDNLDPAGEDPTLRAEWPQRCGWDQCPGIPRREPIQDSGDGFHWHDICRKASVGQDAIHELTTLYRRLAQERKEGAEVSPEPGGEESIDGGTARQVWAVRCGACGVWLPEWNRSREEARIILREHRDEIHD